MDEKCTFKELGQFGKELGATCVTVNHTLYLEAIIAVNCTEK